MVLEGCTWANSNDVPFSKSLPSTKKWYVEQENHLKSGSALKRKELNIVGAQEEKCKTENSLLRTNLHKHNLEEEGMTTEEILAGNKRRDEFFSKITVQNHADTKSHVDGESLSKPWCFDWSWVSHVEVESHAFVSLKYLVLCVCVRVCQWWFHAIATKPWSMLTLGGHLSHMCVCVCVCVCCVMCVASCVRACVIFDLTCIFLTDINFSIWSLSHLAFGTVIIMVKRHHIEFPLQLCNREGSKSSKRQDLVWLWVAMMSALRPDVEKEKLCAEVLLRLT